MSEEFEVIVRKLSPSKTLIRFPRRDLTGSTRDFHEGEGDSKPLVEEVPVIIVRREPRSPYHHLCPGRRGRERKGREMFAYAVNEATVLILSGR